MEAEEVVLLAVQPIRHNGRDYAPGAAFSARPNEAAALLEQGAADTPAALDAAASGEKTAETQNSPAKAPKGASAGARTKAAKQPPSEGR